MYTDKEFELDIFLNKRLLRDFYNHKFNIMEERESQIEEKRERWLKEKIFRIKENILYNNLEGDYLSNLNLNLSNIFYFKHYLKFLTDFESIDFDLSQRMRTNYLRTFFKKDSERISTQERNSFTAIQKYYTNSEEEISKKNERLFFDFIQENLLTPKNDDVICMISSLIAVIMSPYSEDRVILLLLDNILQTVSENEKNLNINPLKRENYENANEIEKNFGILFETLDKRIFLNFEKLEKKFVAIVLNKLLTLALKFRSSILFIHTLYKMREINLIFQDFQEMVVVYFKNRLRNVISFPTSTQDIFRSFEYEHNNEINFTHKIVADESFVYLVLANEKNYLNILKIGTGFKNSLLGKVYCEKLIPIDQGISSVSSGNTLVNGFKNILVIHKEGLNLIQILIFNGKNEMKIFNINKNNLEHVENYDKNEIFSLDDKLLQQVFLFNTNEDFFILCRNLEHVDIENNFILLRLKQNSYSAKRIYYEEVAFTKNSHHLKILSEFSNCVTYFSFFNKYIYFLHNGSKKELDPNVAIFNLVSGKVSQENIKDLFRGDSFYYNKFNNFFLVTLLDNNKTKIKFDYMLNKQSSPYENLDVIENSFLRRKIKMSKLILQNQSSVDSISASGSNSKITNYLLNKLIHSQYDLQTNQLRYEFSESSTEKVQAFFDLFISYYVINLLTFGNLKNSFKQHSDGQNLQNVYTKTYNKQLHNNLSAGYFDVLCERTVNIDLDQERLFLSLVLIKSFLVNVIDLNVSIDEYLGKNLENVFGKLFLIFHNKLTSHNLEEDPAENEILISELYSLLELIVKNSNLVSHDKKSVARLLEVVNEKENSQKIKNNFCEDIPSDPRLKLDENVTKGTEIFFLSNYKILAWNLILSFYEKTKIDLNLVENIIKFELNFIQNEIEIGNKRNISSIGDLGERKNTNETILMCDFIKRFKKLFFNNFFQEIFSWEITDENNLITQIFDLIISHLSILIRNLSQTSYFSKNTQINEYLTNFSFLTHSCLFFVNTVITKSEIASQTSRYFFEKFPFKYFEKIINLMIELDRHSPKNLEEKKFNNLREKSYLFETEHPCENDIKRTLLFKFDETGCEEIKYKFDCMSSMKNDSKIILEYDQNISGPFNTNFPPECQTIQTKGDPKNILMKYSPNSLIKESNNNPETKLSYGFLFKCQNYNSNEEEINVLIEIRRSLINSICKLIFNTLIKNKKENVKGENKKENNLYKALFSSKLLENISINKLNDLKQFYSGSFSNSHYKSLMGVIEKISSHDDEKSKIKEKCLKLFESSKISSMSFANEFSEKSDVSKEISEIISNIVSNTEDYYKKGVNLLQKYFTQKNPWGSVSGREVEHIIAYLFTIILKHERLILKYKEYLEHIHQEGGYENMNPGQIMDIPNFNFFLRVFSECSKLRVWFNERKMQIGEFISSKHNESEDVGRINGMESLSEATEKQIDLEITNYILKITKKAEFLLEVMNSDAEEESSKRNDSSPRGKHKEYTTHVQDLINNLMIYIKTDEVEIQKIIEKIKVQNDKAINKETALICFNILLRIASNKQQDLRDILYWINIIFKQCHIDEAKGNLDLDLSNKLAYNCDQNSQNNLIYFNKDLYGSDTVFNSRVSEQFYNMINCLLDKVQITEEFSLSNSNREIITHLILAQSLIWKMRKRDYIFLRSSKFFEIFLKNSIFSNVLTELDQEAKTETYQRYEIITAATLENENSTQNILKEKVNEEVQYGKECINFELLRSNLLQIMSVYSLQVFDKLNDEIVERISQSTSKPTQLISPRTATTLLTSMRKRSEINEYESFKIINKITDVILLEFEEYLITMNDISQGECDEKVLKNIHKKEEKLNSFLILLYRCLSFNTRLISHLMKYSGDILSTFFQIFLYASDKNKYMVIKFIKLMTVLNYEEEFFINSVNLIKKFLDKKFHNFSKFLNNKSEFERETVTNPSSNSKKRKEWRFDAGSSANFYLLFVIKLIITLLNCEANQKFQFFITTESDKPLAFELIAYLRELTLVKDDVFHNEMKKMIAEIFARKNSAENSYKEKEKEILILILGCEFNPLRVGAKIFINLTHLENKKSLEKSIEEFSIDYNQDVDRKLENKKVGVILGFTESAKNPFIVDETITEFSFETFSYSPKSKYAMIILEENINRENIKNLSYDTMVVENNNLELVSENLFELIENEEILSKNMTGHASSRKKYRLEECLHDTKILENFMRDILSVDSKNLDENFGKLYLTLKIIKNIIYSKNEQLISNLFFEQVLAKFDIKKVLDKFIELSVCSLHVKMRQNSLETLEKNMMYDTLLIKEQITKRNRSNSLNAENFENFTKISQNTKSIFVKFNKTLIKEISFLKLYNADKIIPGCQYCPMIRIESLSEINTRSILFINSEDLRKLQFPKVSIANENFKNIRGIITNEQFMQISDGIDVENLKIPIAVISDLDFFSSFSFIFENVPNEEFEELFLQSIQRDFSSFIDIPPQFVDETVRFGQRDLLLKLLNEDTYEGEICKSYDNTPGYNPSEIEQDNAIITQQLLKLIALISRRILIRLISLKPEIKNYLDSGKVLKVIKLLVYENNIFEIENDHKSNHSENEIVFIIKEFLRSLFKVREEKEILAFDLKIVTSLMDISFLNKYNYIDQKLVINVDTECDLLTFENIENNLKIIYSLINSDKIKNCLFAYEETRHFIKEYEMKIFHALIIKLDDFTIKNKDTGEFILHVLIILLQHISDFIIEQKDESMKASLKQYTFLFKSEEFLRIAKKAKSIFENKHDEIKIDTLDAKIINFFLVFLDLAFLCLARLDIDLNLNYFVTSKMMNLYYAYSLMTKKFKNFEFFVLFCQMKDFVDTKKYLNEHIVRQNFYYKDTTYSTPHLMRYNYESSEGVSVRVLSGNKDNSDHEFDFNSLVLLYSQKDCNSNTLQEYVDCQDINKEILINNSSSNQFYISLPYNGNNHNLFCCGHNEYQSLGCNLEASKIYGTPCKAVGISSKIIKSFKFGYYHCFAVGTDDQVSVCGKDYASGLKELKENSSFTSANHFHDIAAKEGVVNLWVNNYNSTIMLTRGNKLYGCGINTDCNLTNKMNIGNSTNIPYELPPFNPEIKSKVKLVACGFKTSMIIFEDGSGVTVGCNSFHETGNLANTSIVKDYFRLQPPEGCKIINAVSGEHYFVLLIQDRKNKIRLYSMGSNDNGRSGQDIDNSHKLQKCKGVENLEFKSIASRNASSAAITTTGLLYTFGSNETGCLGHGNNTDHLRPTLVEALRDYITDDVSISHNHMVVVARDRMKGEKHLFVSGSNQYGCLGFEDYNLKVKSPKELLFFPEKEPKYTPVRVATSRYQSYLLAMENKIQDEKNNFGIECQYCNAYIKDVLYFRPIKNIQSENNNYSKESDNCISVEQNKMIIGNDCGNKIESNCEFICQMCIINKIGSEIIYMINTPSLNIKKMQFNQLIISKDILKIVNDSEFDVPIFLDNETFSQEVNEYNINYFYKCSDCAKDINSRVYISSFDNSLTLCHSCITNHSNKIEFPQVFYVLNKIRIKESLKKNLPKINDLSKLLWNIEKSEKPYLTLEIVPQISQLEEIRIIGRDKKTFELFSKWKQMSNDHLIELNQIKDEIDFKAKEEGSKNMVKKNDLLTSVSDYLKIIQYLKTDSDCDKYKLIKSLEDEEFNILNELSSSINDCIFYLMNLTFKIKEKGILHQSITENLSLVSSKARLNIFHERLNKLKVAVNASEKELSINRIKAMRFYERKVVDLTGENTIFCQMYQKMKKYPVSNYLCRKENRLFFVNLTGEGATDYGGPYREVFSTACEELHSPHLDLFIKSPNSRNEVGALRDKYIVNPSARSAFYIDMYFFIGCLIGYAISSGHLLNLNIHPKIWKLILSQQVDFAQYETIDKLFYKYINDISTTSIRNQKDFEMVYDQYFVIQLSDGSEYELVPNGKRIQLTLYNKENFVNLAKNARLNEFKIQIESIRSGLT